MVEKRIIKASEIEESGINVAKLDYAIRKFGDKVYKQPPLDELPLAMEESSGLPDFQPEGETPQISEEPEVRIERAHSDDGELTGLKITCRCGEVIELEFTREQDELPAADSTVDATEPVAEAQPSAPEPETPAGQPEPEDQPPLADNLEAEEQEP